MQTKDKKIVPTGPWMHPQIQQSYGYETIASTTELAGSEGLVNFNIINRFVARKLLWSKINKFKPSNKVFINFCA